MHKCTGALVHRSFSLLLLLLPLLSSCSEPRVSESPRPRVETEQAQPARIVSLAPSITETLFALGLGDRVAGVTRYCDYPLDAVGRPVVGGYFDVNYEILISLKPDLVIHTVEHEDARARLTELGFTTLSVNHSRVNGILESITTIAARCGVSEAGEELRRSLEGRIKEIQEGFSPKLPSSHAPMRPLALSPPRVLVAVGRLLDKGPGGEVFISGRDGFYDDLIVLAGGVNAYRQETLKFPAISDEGLVRLDPDVIIEMVPDLQGQSDKESLMSIWRARRGVRAVREGQVHILGEDYVVVPGPRFIDLLEDIAEIIQSTRYPVSGTRSGGTVVGR